MSRRTINLCTVVALIAVLFVPLVTTNLTDGVVSVAERRTLASKPRITTDEGALNRHFFADFETWFNDNVGLRELAVTANGQVQYRLFRNLAGDYSIGPNGEFNYTSEGILTSYRHADLLSDEQLASIARSYQTLKDYVESSGAQFYYCQCWDKQSIYPEQFPQTVNQYGALSRTDQFVAALQAQTDICVIDTKPSLIAEKGRWQTYSRYGDPAHWSVCGAYVGYLDIMGAINSRNDGRFRVLQESDYDLSLSDQSESRAGDVREVEMLESFELLEPHATRDLSGLTVEAQDQRSARYVNPDADNDCCLLVLGDSYLQSYLLDDLAESFRELVFINGDNTPDIEAILDAYHPDIVLNENAERVWRGWTVIETAEKLSGEG